MKTLKIKLNGIEPLNSEQMRKIKGGYAGENCNGACDFFGACEVWPWNTCQLTSDGYVCMTSGASACVSLGGSLQDCCGS